MRDFRQPLSARSRRALAHYGVQTLDRSPELEESLLWIYKSHQRVEQQIAPVVGVLERRLQQVADAVAAALKSPFARSSTGWSP